jgi:hypothetical protein
VIFLDPPAVTAMAISRASGTGPGVQHR